ncbi:protein limb expression 1 [Oryzias melastigma]|uniref:Limb and CNS expressed 1 n=1 Tax=Oryzias melastigma TaxID=30732 RepID=A0A3B3BDK7_ORYME|nr:protein limb expression 1 [Oryzias melastigma]
MSSKEMEESIISYLSQSETDDNPKNLNVVAILHNFWEQKQRAQSDDSSAGSEMESLLLYESASSPGPPYVCYVTLPGGSCFGNYKVCDTQAEARRDAARVALMNSLVNELPCRRISPDFIFQSLQQAAKENPVLMKDAHDPNTSIGTYNLLLHSFMGRTMLEFQEMMTVFQLLQWNGTLKALRERQYSRQSVIAYYCQRGLDEYMHSSMALDWLGREQRSPGLLGLELQVAQKELVLARRRGIELRFYKEKNDILSLALSQAYIQHPPEMFEQESNHTCEQEQLPLHPLHSCDADAQISQCYSPSPVFNKKISDTGTSFSSPSPSSLQALMAFSSE